MEHKGTKVIETERLMLRKFKIYDAEGIFKNWASDAEVTKYLTWEPHNSIADTKELLKKWIRNYKEDNFYHWAIVLKEEEKLIGSISVVKSSEKTELAHIGYCLDKDYWNKGIMTEASKAVIDFLFTEVKYHCIQSSHDPRNGASGAVMKKCAMKHDGTLRQADYNNQGICDACYYSILLEEYEGYSI